MFVSLRAFDYVAANISIIRTPLSCLFLPHFHLPPPPVLPITPHQERAQGLDVSPMCDRYTANFEGSQLGFIDFVVHPLWEIWNEVVYPEGRYVLEHLAANRMELEKRKRRESVTEW